MINGSEKAERLYLEYVKERLHAVIEQIDSNIKRFSDDLKEGKKYLYENKAGMDHVEKVSVRQSITQGALTGEAAVEKMERLNKLLDSPYFGRFDFLEQGKDDRMPVYIGIHSFFDESENVNLVHDWRAPISSMYYDFELGEASYEAPGGNVPGKILLKRQYRVRKGKMEFMLENSVNVHDDILQDELSKNSDSKMQNIIATIQRDQNKIIRNETSNVLIIQGVSGSGKTSIALHRIAFLLYRFREYLASKDVLILSPNKVFADYISNVLPELGEEKIPEMGMEELASTVLGHKIRFQTFYEQIDKLLNREDKAFKERIRFKASFDFISKLDEYITHVENNNFKPTDLWVKKYYVPIWFVAEKYEAYHRVPLLKRYLEISHAIEENIRFYYKYDINATERNEIRKTVRGMFAVTNLRDLYKQFYTWLERPELFKTEVRNKFEYADVFPFIYLKLRLEGINGYDNVKHLLVDEMQDYTPVQYAVLSRLFHCRKTILGDIKQAVNPYSSSSSDDIKKVFPGADHLLLSKSYRSTYEIIKLAQKVSYNNDLMAIERHGEEPGVKALNNNEEEIAEIGNLIRDFENTSYKSLAIICKNQNQAKWLKDNLPGNLSRISMLTAQSNTFSRGIIITTAYMAKGLEFDQVIVPFAYEDNYKTSLDKNMLYVAITRAMHKLNITYVKKCTGFIKDNAM